MHQQAAVKKHCGTNDASQKVCAPSWKVLRNAVKALGPGCCIFASGIDVVDFSAWSAAGGDLLRDGRIFEKKLERGTAGDLPVYKGAMFGLKGYDGFYVAPNALSLRVQRKIALCCIEKYNKMPHK